MYTVYALEGCEVCEAACSLLNHFGLEYEELFLNTDFIPAELFERAGRNVRTLPQIFNESVYIGNLDDLRLSLEDIVSPA